MEKLPFKRLKGQTALITGAATGIGRATAIQMAREGANVAIDYLSDSARAREVTKIIKDAGGKAVAIQADISREEQVKTLFRKVIETYGTVHILVSNAGIQNEKAVDKMSLEEWQKVINVNLTGTFLCAREAIREFKKRGIQEQVSRAAGKIICISSIHDQVPWARHANYTASKGGIMLLMKSMALEAAPHKIRINSIGPGAIKTPINPKIMKDARAREKLGQSIPYRRVGEPEDIAMAAVWLASDESDYVTGTTLYVDGGMGL